MRKNKRNKHSEAKKWLILHTRPVSDKIQLPKIELKGTSYWPDSGYSQEFIIKEGITGDIVKVNPVEIWTIPRYSTITERRARIPLYRIENGKFVTMERPKKANLYMNRSPNRTI